MAHMDAWYWRVLEEKVYRLPPSPPRKRTKPMEVLCVGCPRTGTESLQQALLTLGYDHTHHGWDILFEQPLYSPGWVKLARRKFYGQPDGDVSISAAEFDELLGNSTAVTDAAGSVFAPELIAAYPDAKVVLNVRRDEDAWYKSVCSTILGETYDITFLWLMSWFQPELFWAWHVYHRNLWAHLFRAPDGDMRKGITKNAKWIYRDHNNMIRGLVPKERLLEWSVEDGWAPLCDFLGKDVPAEDFPHVNTREKGFKGRVDQITKLWVGKAIRNMALTVTALAFFGAVTYRCLT